MLGLVAIFFVAISVFVLAWQGLVVGAGAVGRYHARYAGALADPREALRFVDRRSLLLLGTCAVLPTAAAGLVAVGPIAAVLAGLAALVGPIVAVRSYRRRWLRRFEGQLVDALGAIAGALRAGLTFSQAIEQIARDAPQPLSRELVVFGRELRLGVPQDEALANLSARVGSDDLDLVVVATGIARQLGGNLAEIYDTLAATTRERFRLDGKIEALTAQGRLQGWILAALPPLLGAVLDWIRPDLIGPMMSHPFGWGLLGLIALLELLGLVSIRRIVRIDVWRDRR